MRYLSARDQLILQHTQGQASLFGRDDLLPVVVRGADRVKFLQAMLSQDIKGLAENGVATACLCDAQGAMVAVAEVVMRPDAVMLWTQRQSAQLLLEGLDKFVIMDDVELSLEEDWALVELLGPSAHQVAAAAQLPWPQAGLTEHLLAGNAGISGAEALLWATMTGGAPDSPLGEALPSLLVMVTRDLQGDVAQALVAAGAQLGSHAVREVLRVAAGQVLLVKDVTDGSLPLEVGLKGAVSFRKGCYVGQEAIAMMTYRGQIRRHLCWVRGELSEGAAGGDGAPQAGWNLRTADGKRAGRLGTCVTVGGSAWYGLALIPRRAFAAGAQLQASDDSGHTVSLHIVQTTVAGALDSAPAEGAV